MEQQLPQQPNTTENKPKKSNWGCIIIGGLGCLWLLVMAALVIGAVVYYALRESDNTITEYDDWFETVDDYTNTNTDTDDNRGFAITEPLSDIDAAYQVIAYPTTVYTDSECTAIGQS